MRFTAFLLSVFAALSLAAEDIQSRIDAAAALGGGVVRVSSGLHVSPALRLKTGVTLHLEKGAVLRAETNLCAYAINEGHAFILAESADRVAIEGEGVIDGGGDLFPADSLDFRQQPRLVWFRDCRDVRIEGVTLRNGRRWLCYLARCDGVLVRKVKIRSLHQRKGDGFDIESKNVLIEDCDIETQDDSIVFKAHSMDYAVENVTVRNCRLASNCNLIKVGTETLGTIRNIVVEDCVCRRASTTFAHDRSEWVEFIFGSGTSNMLVNAWPTERSGRDGLTLSGMTPDTDYTVFMCVEDFDGNVSPMYFETIRTAEIQVGPDPTINMALVPSKFDNYDWTVTYDIDHDVVF